MTSLYSLGPEPSSEDKTLLQWPAPSPHKIPGVSVFRWTWWRLPSGPSAAQPPASSSPASGLQQPSLRSSSIAQKNISIIHFSKWSNHSESKWTGLSEKQFSLTSSVPDSKPWLWTLWGQKTLLQSKGSRRHSFRVKVRTLENEELREGVERKVKLWG